ncbi:unnamed protein product [Meloidogyne enterolobii]|uniref:Uncharacterized protein n=1 Tax=Meloidogyne enterolobii TaxID=390850 RepID=A0ACB0Z3W4_MELEN
MSCNKFVVVDQIPPIYQDSGTDLSQALSSYEVSTGKVKVGVLTLFLQKFFVLLVIIGKLFYLVAALRLYIFRLVLSIDSDLHVFDLSVGCVEFCLDSSKGRLNHSKGVKEKHSVLTEEDGNVVEVCFLPDRDVFMVLLSKGTILFMSPNNRYTHRQVFCNDCKFILNLKSVFPPLESCSTCTVSTQNGYSTCILDRQKSVLHFISIPAFDYSIRDELEFRDNFSGVELVRSIEIAFQFKCHFLVSSTNNFVLFPRDPGMVTSLSIHLEEIKNYPEDVACFSSLFKIKQPVKIVKNFGCFVVALISNKLQFYNENYFLFYTLALQDEQIVNVLDFEFLDVENFSEFATDVKLLLKVLTKNNDVEFMIRQVNQKDVQFSKICSEYTMMIPYSTPNDDSSIVYVDACPAKSRDMVFLRFVNHSQPLTRLHRLLDLKYFADALSFAITYNLSVDLVYEAIIHQCQEKIQNAEDGNYEEATFIEMMKNLKLISDNDSAGDMVVASLPFLNCFAHINEILVFAKGLTITDEYTLKEIERLRFEFESFSLVYDKDNINYSRTSDWHNFYTSDTHKEFFDRFCEKGKIAEARTLFSRYPDISQKLMDKEAFHKLLYVFRDVIKANSTLCCDISQFMQTDLISVFLHIGQDDTKQICEDLCSFFISISLLLEEIEPKLFPKNALEFSKTFDRAIELLKEECQTPEKYGQDVGTICQRVLDRVRSAPSIHDYIQQFVFPYIEEHYLDKNEVLYNYIKNLSSSYRHVPTQKGGNTWDVLCLKITEQITDSNIRCRAILEIAVGTVPPWNNQLSTVVKNILSQEERIDPKLFVFNFKKYLFYFFIFRLFYLRRQCSYADLGQIFIKYQIPLETRSKLISTSSVQQLLQFIFINSSNDMVDKLKDGFAIVEIYHLLQSTTSTIDCYYIYAIVLVRQFTYEDDIKPLLDLFSLIKSKEIMEAVATKLVILLKSFLEPSKLKKIIIRRPVWISCLLAVLERFLPDTTDNRALIRSARSLRQLQNNHQIILGFNCLKNTEANIKLLDDFIEASSDKSIVEVIRFGTLLELPLKTSCVTLMRAQIRRNLPEAVLESLIYLLDNYHTSEKSIIENALEACTYVCWKFTDLIRNDSKSGNGDELIDYSINTISSFKEILPKLVDWAVQLEEITLAESFFPIIRYVNLFSFILNQINKETDAMPNLPSRPSSVEPNKNLVEKLQQTSFQIHTLDHRMGVFLPQNEGVFTDSLAVVRAISAIGASVVEPFVDTAEKDEYIKEMCKSWEKLFLLLSNSHVLLEVYARQFANTLPCFNSNKQLHTIALTDIDRRIFNVCKKIFSFPVADLHLAAYLLFSLSKTNMFKTLKDLRTWALTKKNVRYTLNLIRASLFVLIYTSQELTTIKQVASWFDSTLWQKRLFKQGVNLGNTQLKRETVFDLCAEFAKLILPSSILKEYCDETNGVDTASILLNYGIELCKFSSCLSGPSNTERFTLCIETAKQSFEYVRAEEKSLLIINQTIRDICPYNYEALEILVNKMKEILESGVRLDEIADRINDAYMLFKFLKAYTRQGSVAPIEIRWYRHFVNPKYFDTSLLTKSGPIEAFDDTCGSVLNQTTISAGQENQQKEMSLLTEASLPPSSQKRLPYHIFTLEEKEPIERWQMPFIYSEVSIKNVQLWVSLIENTKCFLQHSRTSLLVAAINSHVKDIVKYNRELEDVDVEDMENLIYESHNRKTKIGLIDMCCNILQKWTKNAKELQISPKEVDQFTQNSQTLRQLLAVLKTEFLLEKNQLLDSETNALTQKPEELIIYLLCSSKLDWGDVKCSDKYFYVIDQVSHIHSVNKENIFNELIDRWILSGSYDPLYGGSGIAQIVTPDLEATIDFMGTGSSGQMTNNEDPLDVKVLPMLYDDMQIIRVVALLRRIENPKEKIVEISRKLKLDVSCLPGGYLTKIRIASCILRFVDADQMQELFKMNIGQFYREFIPVLNQRLSAIGHVEIPFNISQDSSF